MSKGGTTSAGSATEIPQWVQDAGRKQYQTGTELGQIGYTPYYGADVAAFNPMQESAFRSTGTAADAFGMGPASTVPAGATFGAPSPTWATDGIPTPQTFSGNMRGYSGMPMYTQALQTLEEQRPYQKQQLEQQFIDPTTGLTPEGRKIQDINSLYNEAFNRNVGLEGVSTYLPLMQQGMTKNELRRVLYDSDEGRALGKSSLGAPIEIGVGGGLLGGAQYVPPALPSGSSGISDVVANTQPVINQPAITQPVINQTVDQIAAGQQTIGDTLTDTDMSTATPSTFDLYGSQIDQLMPIYQQELGRGLQDPEALAYYGDQLKNGLMTPEQVRANISGSIEGQQYDAKQAAAAQNSANLGFGATTGNASDDAFQINEMNRLLAANQAARLNIVGPRTDYDNDFMNVLKGAEEYRQGFVNDLSGLLDSLTGNNANSLISSSTTDSSYTNGNNANNFNNVTVTPYGSNSDNTFRSLTQLMDQEDDYRNRFISPY
tara:strand:- start:3155 stop:4624 length:1470 start_codon:yes stop_codon:yes gene_type:complete